MLKWYIEERNIKDLTPHPKNPRYLSKEQGKHLMTSLSKFGLADKPIINTDGMIIGGHQRLKIMEELGHEIIECWVPSEPLSPEEVDELNIRLNKNTGEWAWECLANEWNVDDLCEWGFEPKDFYDDGTKPQKKPSVTIEFSCKDDLDHAMDTVKQIQEKYLAKVKLKI